MSHEPFCDYPECPLHRESSPVGVMLWADLQTGWTRKILRHRLALGVFPPVMVWLCADCAAAPDAEGRLMAAADAKAKPHG